MERGVIHRPRDMCGNMNALWMQYLAHTMIRGGLLMSKFFMFYLPQTRLVAFHYPRRNRRLGCRKRYTDQEPLVEGLRLHYHEPLLGIFLVNLLNHQLFSRMR